MNPYQVPINQVVCSTDGVWELRRWAQDMFKRENSLEVVADSMWGV